MQSGIVPSLQKGLSTPVYLCMKQTGECPLRHRPVPALLDTDQFQHSAPKVVTEKMSVQNERMQKPQHTFSTSENSGGQRGRADIISGRGESTQDRFEGLLG